MIIDLKKMYEAFGENLAYGMIENGGDYLDLYNEAGELVAMDGDEVDIWRCDDKKIVLENMFDGKHFAISADEFGASVFA